MFVRVPVLGPWLATTEDSRTPLRTTNWADVLMALEKNGGHDVLAHLGVQGTAASSVRIAILPESVHEIGGIRGIHIP